LGRNLNEGKLKKGNTEKLRKKRQNDARRLKRSSEWKMAKEAEKARLGSQTAGWPAGAREWYLSFPTVPTEYL
jgi:hypothetical protein